MRTSLEQQLRCGVAVRHAKDVRDAVWQWKMNGIRHSSDRGSV
ncbi:hypothetical protein [Terriglobus roseus]|nr:hypothetical protein [Terriglobus roseus]